MHTSQITTNLLRMVEALDRYPTRTPNQQLLRDRLYEAYTQGRVAETEDLFEEPTFPEYLTQAIRLYEDLAFACGAWTDEDGTESYIQRSDRLADARQGLATTIRRYRQES